MDKLNYTDTPPIQHMENHRQQRDNLIRKVMAYPEAQVFDPNGEDIVTKLLAVATAHQKAIAAWYEADNTRSAAHWDYAVERSREAFRLQRDNIVIWI